MTVFRTRAICWTLTALGLVISFGVLWRQAVLTGLWPGGNTGLVLQNHDRIHAGRQTPVRPQATDFTRTSRTSFGKRCRMDANYTMVIGMRRDSGCTCRYSRTRL